MQQEALEAIGLNEKEAAVYVMLLRLGPSSASTVAGKLGYDRTTTYYLLLRMLEKNYVSERVQENVKMFAPTKPADILSFTEQKHELFREAIPELESLFGKQTNPFIVDVRQGKAGIRYLYRDAINEGGEVLGFGIDDEQYAKIDSTGLDQYYRDATAAGMNERFLTHKGMKAYGSPISEHHYVDEKYFQPTPTFVYGNKIVMIAWEPNIQLIFIENEELANSFRKHFEALWEVAEKRK